MCGFCIDDAKVNQLFQLQADSKFCRLSHLLQKPDSWRKKIQQNPDAIEALRRRILKPIPATFQTDECAEFVKFRQHCTYACSITMLGEKVQVAYLITAIDKKHQWLNLSVSKLSALLSTYNIPCV